MGLELEASASIGVAIGDKLDKLHGLLSKEDPKPRIFQVPGSVTYQTSSPLIVMGRPPHGCLWNILTVTVTGADDHTAIASAYASLYVDSDSSNLGLGQCVMPGMAIPSFQAISKGTLWAHSSGNIVINLDGTGMTAGTNVQCLLTVAEWHVSEVTRVNTR
jgi:hypothetical protein